MLESTPPSPAFAAGGRSLGRLGRALAAASGDCGPDVARIFQRLLAALFGWAFISLGLQVHELIGSAGLLPIEPFLDGMRDRVSFWQLPSLLWLGASDRMLTVGVALGIALSLVALVGRGARLAFAALTLLYLSFVLAGRTFYSFQWDNLLLEAGALAVFLPSDRASRPAHLLFRLLLFKLYWESGVAKWQSHLGDWQDGSAMTYYYETAPLPTWLAWYAHKLPLWWHHVESWTTLVLELVVPLLLFGPRRARLFACVALTAFQVVNAATANYGFFCYLTVALHVFLLDERDLARPLAWVRAHWPRRLSSLARVAWPARREPRRASAARQRAMALLVAFYVLASTIEGYANFGRIEPWLERHGVAARLLDGVREIYLPFRLINTYHLFGHITRVRVEPQLSTLGGDRWTEHDFKHKPGDVRRAPDVVAPYQPRVDFQLWFYGLDFARDTPAYILVLLDRVCRDPAAVRGLFAAPLPPHAQAVKLSFYRYRFTTRAERLAQGAWWRRELLDETKPLPCESIPDADGRDDRGD